MNTRWNPTLRDQLDLHWDHQVRPRYDGLVDEELVRWREGVSALGEDGPARPMGTSEGPYAHRPFADLVLHINRELLRHGAEIALLRDLYLHTHEDTRKLQEV